MNYLVRDINLAENGAKKIAWVKEHMPVLNEIRKEFERDKPFNGKRVAISMHLEAKTAYLALVLQAGGANVSITGSNPLSTQDDVAAALAAQGLQVFSWYNATPEEYKQHLLMVLDTRPDIIIDDGGDLMHLIHTERPELASSIIGGCEETTTGVLRLRALEKENRLPFPMIAVNDAYSKYLFDNRYGTGESVWTGIMRTTNLIVAGKTVVVIGYGWCGKGVAMRAKGLGAKIIICEVDPIKAIEAHMDGFQVMTMDEAAALGDVFITVTGCKDVIRRWHYEKMKNGVLLANAGHFDVEINKPELNELAISKRVVRKDIEEFTLADGRKLYLLAEGRLVNLAAGDGHPAEIMDTSFALQALSARYLVENGTKLEKKVYLVSPEIDRRVAELKLQSLGITIDKLTPEQEAYLYGWQHGE
ncbi:MULTISPECIES: adenosylhomocysteinase [Carboxydocella]|uniref:Adenosylhomocysteinase n=2 Tax=Carboxydocella TaxID=178898 RepID=A0A1T4PXA0_9FIRM|nr:MULTISPECIES: adenosylhomocysteinase [Carboxydocella]AVX20472.1 adenosylhomocysteinase [Carboxydocella thermautotrophica]AVX30893.1 adenosylhomocysteinase [Carboxydocella thermautotrophica]SJZ95956.1 adenosylhomocysteinase [Carboxydocella sporoproducens DSM 16521]GAW29711.1 adenosylhomocysteinase [Carboxydocella sp. ULO1]GAW32214.1 adenosylhomocysteinase [Carboxydocella sp. JDF658]